MKKYKVYTKEKGLVETNEYRDIDHLIWHREDGPAFIKYYNNGNLAYEEYRINNKRHRLDGPACINYYNGLVEYEEYRFNDKIHRLDGPACIEYDNNSNITFASYWINGMSYTKENYYNELLKLKVQSL